MFDSPESLRAAVGFGSLQAAVQAELDRTARPWTVEPQYFRDPGDGSNLAGANWSR